MAKRLLMPFLYPQAASLPRVAAPLPLLRPLISTRHASKATVRPGSKKKRRKDFKQQTLDKSMQWSLCDAMRYIHAFEAGRNPTIPKYDLAIRLRTRKNGPIIRGGVRLPHSVETPIRTCVICPPRSPIEANAKKAGAVLTGEGEVFEAVKAGRIDFDRCLCHPESLTKLNQSGIARMLGPKGLMPSVKLGTVTKDIKTVMEGLVGITEYKERLAVIRAKVGRLASSPEEMQANIRAFMAKIKEDADRMSDECTKEIHEVVLSSTNSPGFSLNGDFRSETSLPTESLVIDR